MNKIIKACLTLSIIFFFTFGITLIVISFMPFNEVKALLDYFSPDGNVETFYIKHVILIGFSGILLCVVGGLIYVIRKKVLQYVSEVVSEVKISDFLINPKSIMGFIFNFIRDLREGIKKEDKIHTYSFFLIVLLALAVRLYYISQPWVTDETRIFENYVSHAYGLKGLFKLLSQYIDTGHHMFYTFMSYLSYKFLGGEQSLWLIRLPALLAGILLVPATYMVIRMFYDKYSALLASGIIAASPLLILYSTRGRGHIFLCLIFMLLIALAAYLLKNNNLAGWHLFAILSALGFYTIPIMLWPYGIVITWFMLSMVFNDELSGRNYLLKNLFVCVVLTVILTFLLYSPVIFFGTGLKSLISKGPVRPIPWEIFTGHILSNVGRWIEVWNKHVPVLIVWLFEIGFLISLIYHKKLSAQRINIALASAVWFIPVYLIIRQTPSGRHVLFLLVVYIGLASAGLTYLFRKVEKVFGNYKSAIFSLLTIILSVVMIGNYILLQPWFYGNNSDNIDESGKYIDIMFVSDRVGLHMIMDGKDNYNAKNGNFYKWFDKWEFSPRILTVFRSSEKNNYFLKELQRFNGILVITDMDSYLSKDSRRCHSLFLVSTESISSLKVLLEEKGLSLSDYSTPQLVHNDKYANLFKMSRITDCREK